MKCLLHSYIRAENKEEAKKRVEEMDHVTDLSQLYRVSL